MYHNQYELESINQIRFSNRNSFVVRHSRHSSISTMASSMRGMNSQDGDSLSLVQLQDLGDALRVPLTDRQVLIPFGKKAFFPGKLAPTRISGVDEGDHDKDEECVMVRLDDGELSEMTRQQARDHIQGDIDALLRKKRTKPASVRETAPPPKPNDNPPSFFDIREEIDDDGKEVRGEVVDISKPLGYIEKQESGGDFARRPMSTHDEGGDGFVESEEMATLPSDEDYKVLSDRLDELAKLEEEAEKSRSRNQKSSKKLQSKGWSSGFLNKKNLSKKTTARTPTLPTSTKPVDSTSGPKVGFRADDQVREIPRVGERSVNEIRKRTTTSTKGIRQPIDTSVLSGVVQERTASNQVQERRSSQPKKKLSRFAQERRQMR